MNETGVTRRDEQAYFADILWRTAREQCLVPKIDDELSARRRKMVNDP